jgi:hypothetical protein
MRFRYTLLAATLMAGSTVAAALAQPAPLYDPSQLPEVKGTVSQYMLTPRGDVDGFILTNGTEVYMAPRLSTQIVFAVKPGDAVTIHGLQAKAVPLVLADSVTNDATHATVVGAPQGPRGNGWNKQQLEASGQVKAELHSPNGLVDGVLLTDGTIVRLPPLEAEKRASLLAPGKTIAVQGFGYAGPLGKIVAAREIGPDAAHLEAVAGPGFPGPEQRFFGHRSMMGGPGGGMMGGPNGGMRGGPGNGRTWQHW